MRYLWFNFLLLFALPSISIMAQEDLLTQVEVEWEYIANPESRWSHFLFSRYRSVFYSSGEFKYTTEFLEWNIATKYAIKPDHSVSFIFRYHIKELFDNALPNEKRIVQQYNHGHSLKRVKLKGRLRVEQRFRERFNLRNRYRLGMTFPLNKNDNALKKWLLTVDTEALWSIIPHKSPTFDQRFTLLLEKPISKMLVLKLKPQYRYLDYTHDAHDIWQIYAIFSVSL